MQPHVADRLIQVIELDSDQDEVSRSIRAVWIRHLKIIPTAVDDESVFAVPSGALPTCQHLQTGRIPIIKPLGDRSADRTGSDQQHLPNVFHH